MYREVQLGRYKFGIRDLKRGRGISKITWRAEVERDMNDLDFEMVENQNKRSLK